ncbi:MAG TPA: carboxypeptidase regulatory-like domain-containing protein [Micromonosporaceae bacterium]|nr:carboxypeptidase regulatory-like domain-containing protein [Micromonosporaceae bacterium]
MRLSLLSRLAVAGAMLGAAVLSAASTAHAANGTGSITGHVTTSDGAPASFVAVEVYDDEWSWVGYTQTDASGNYTFGGLATGSYLIGFTSLDGFSQYYHQKTEMWQADAVSVVNGEATTVNEQFLSTGTITGQLRDRAGDPLRNIFVQVSGGSAWYHSQTDDEGRYRMTVLPGRYVVGFEPIEGLWQSQFIPQQLTPRTAIQFEVRANEETVADDTMLPTGSLSGRFTTTAGQPLADTDVYITTSEGNGAASVTTDSNGEFAVPTLLLGSYKIAFSHGERHQYYAGKNSFEEADLVTVRADEETRITDSLLPTGSVRVIAVDAKTGNAIPDFCVQDVCSNGTGKATVTELPAGRHTLYVHTEGGTHMFGEVDVDVLGNQTVDVTVKLQPVGRIAMKIVDRQTGAPVANVCAAAIRTEEPQLPDGYGYCSDRHGQLTLGLLKEGTYNLYIDPGQVKYGRQWVGESGGTGDQRSAATIVAEAGTTAQAPPVLLDPAGTIIGQVTDAATGTPVQDVGVGLLGTFPGLGPTHDVRTDKQGRYEFTGLGPYEWPLLFVKHGYADQWSGNVGDRFAATKIPVTAGATATYDIGLVRGTEVRGNVTTQDGGSAGQGFVMAHNVVTGDRMGAAWMSDGQYSMRVLGVQRVYLTYYFHDGNDRSYQGRYLPKQGPDQGIYTIPTADHKIIDMVIPTS